MILFFLTLHTFLLRDTQTLRDIHENNFTYDDHIELAEIFTKMATNKLRLILTNSDTHFVKSLYKKHKIITVESKRLINIKSDKRKSRDLIIYANI